MNWKINRSSEIQERTIGITNVRIICQLSDQITDMFGRSVDTSRFVTFASVLVNEHPNTATANFLIQSKTFRNKIRPNFDVLATLLNLQLSIDRTAGLNRINFPLIVQHFDQCFSQELGFGLSDGHWWCSSQHGQYRA